MCCTFSPVQMQQPARSTQKASRRGGKHPMGTQGKVSRLHTDLVLFAMVKLDRSILVWLDSDRGSGTRLCFPV